MTEQRVHSPIKKIQSAFVINVLLTFGIMFVLALLVDGFLLHSISAPKGTFELGNSSLSEFDLTDSDASYSDALVVDQVSGGEGAKIYLVNQNDELHLLYFHKHWATQRLALWNDITVEDSGAESYELGWTYDRYSVEISDGRIAEVTSSGGGTYLVYIGIYVTISAVITVVESFIFLKIVRRRKASG